MYNGIFIKKGCFPLSCVVNKLVGKHKMPWCDFLPERPDRGGRENVGATLFFQRPDIGPVIYL